jgi:diguanylate cyclase (GGDEF)-like protein
MPSVKIDRQNQLDRLRQRYGSKLPQRVAELSERWAAADARAQSLDTLRSLMFITHSLAGSASTFGYLSLGGCARRLEMCLQQVLDRGELADADGAVIGALVDDIVRWGNAAPDGSLAITMSPSAEPKQSDSNTVFVVDDDESLAQEIAIRLRDYGYAVEVHVSPAEAEAALAERTPLAVLLDMDLGKGVHEGPQMIERHLRVDDSNVPVIMVSVHEGWRARLAALRAGATAYFNKPIDFPSLVETLDRMTGRSKPAPFRIMVLDDVEELAQHHAEVLRGAGMDVRAFCSPFEALDQLAEFKPDLLLMDLYMPECSGTELSALIRQKPSYDSLPIIFLSVENRLDDHLQALRVGGDEFLLKPIRADHLIAAVSIRAGRFRALSELMRTDGLTGLLTQITTRLQLEELLPLALRRNSPLCFAMLDIDNFKRVNDEFGHPAGDRVLRMLARQLRQSLRRTDVIGRYGGEEFAVVLPDTPLAEAVRLIDDLRARFAALVQQHGTRSFRVTFSAGLACSERHPQMDGLINAADRALYQAKESGRNRVCVDPPASQLEAPPPRESEREAG